MGPDEARQVDAMLRRYGIAGVVAPKDPERPAAAWSVFDQADPASRRETTAEVLAAVARHVQPDAFGPTGPTRGFVIPPRNDAA